MCCEFLGMCCEFLGMCCEYLGMCCEFLGMCCEFLGMCCKFLEMCCEFLGMCCEYLGMCCEFLGMCCEFLGMCCKFLGMWRSCYAVITHLAVITFDSVPEATLCLRLQSKTKMIRDLMQFPVNDPLMVVRSIPRGRSTEVFLVLASAPQLV